MRMLLAILIMMTAPAMSAAAEELDLEFQIKRDGKTIGHHRVTVTETEAGFFVETDVRMRVNLGPVKLFGYDHHAVEEWRDGQLYALVAETDNNGERARLRAQRTAAGLLVDGESFAGLAPEDAAPASGWNRDLVAADRIIDLERGEIIDISVESRGITRAPNNQFAEEFKIVGTIEANVWYDGERWVGSHVIVDGEELTYELKGPEVEAQDFAMLSE